MKRKLLLLVSLIMAASTLGIAESTDCNNPTDVVPDGRSVQGYFPASVAHYFRFEGQPAHSYVIELVWPYDNQTLGLSGEKWFRPGDSFCGSGSLTITDVTFMAPWASVNGSGWRVSFTASATGYYGFGFVNSATAGYYTFRVVDTTMFNPRWSTWSGFASTWGFNNNSDHDMSGTFTIYDGSGNVLKTVSVTVPAGKVKFYSSGPSDLNLPNNVAGSAMFAFVGPPGAIQADAYMLNSNATVVIPTKFETRNVQ